MPHRYVRPKNIPPDMGGKDNELDSRMSSVLELMEYAPLQDVETILDIGFGKGQLSKWLTKKVKQVTATCIEIESYNIDVTTLQNKYGIKVVECNAERMPFPDESFDAVVMSHVLEHCPNVQMTLIEVRRILKDGGHFFIFVPHHDNIVCAGHISMGWNIGQIMYVLLLAGFDIRKGNFIDSGQNVCGFVRTNSTLKLPPLRGDRGDIYILNEHNLFPILIRTRDGFNDGFWANIQAINWEPKHIKQLLYKSKKKKIVSNIIGLLPSKMKKKLGNYLVTLGNLLINSSIENSNINPKHLSG